MLASGRAVGVLIVVVTVFLGFCGFVDALVQPRRAFKASGHSKALWVAIEFVGMCTCLGAITWAWYSFGVRRQVVRAGGANRPGDALKGRGGGGSPGAPGAPGGGSPFGPPTRTPCGSCSGGSTVCSPCSGTGRVGTEMHAACGGSGRYRCAMCNGTGYR